MTQPLDHKQRLLDRLDAIAAALRDSGAALALLGLGSVGRELERLDAYSDLDFFAIVQAGQKARFIANLDWLAAPIAFSFQNTQDGCKVLYEDGIFAEYAVFEPDELAPLQFPPGRIIWQAHGFDAALVERGVRSGSKPALEFVLGEALTNLYVGLGRFRRGEKLTALRFVQVYAVDQIMRMAPYIEPDQPALRDPFGNERRFEQRFPGIAASLPQFMQGYERTPESARAMLAFIEAHFEVNAALKARILELIDQSI